MEEIWKNIDGFEDEYMVSNLGRVKSIDRKSFDCSKYNFYKGNVLKPQRNRNGYLYILLSRNGHKYYRTIHRLVANAFIRNPLNKREVDHIDTDKSNNVVSNLRWATRKENVNNQITKIKVIEAREKNKTRNRKYRPIIRYSIDLNSRTEYNCIADACDENNYDCSTIRKSCKGLRKTAYRFIWKDI